jgi:hypothetical protein
MTKVPEGPGGDVFTVPEEHRAAVLEGFEQAERGEYASDDEMAVAMEEVRLIKQGSSDPNSQPLPLTPSHHAQVPDISL